jgi:hypothetical protein
MNKAAFSKLIEAMRSLSNEVNDQEICRRLETLMLTLLIASINLLNTALFI